jgi:hypothetical protein
VDGLTDGICKIIIPNQEGGFLIEGLAGDGHFQKFDAADAFTREQLARMMRVAARAAGTSSRIIELKNIFRPLPTANKSSWVGSTKQNCPANSIL